MAKIAVTGSAGTIGVPLCADLARDHEVVRIDLRDADVIADVRDLGALTKAFAGCETVVHLAGFPSLESPWEDVHETDIGGTYNAFEAARRAGCKRLIFASSNHAVGRYEVENLPAIYEPGFGLVVRTDAEYRPDSLYGVWKVFGEALGRYYSDAFGLQVTCVRIGSMTKADDPRDESVRAELGLAAARRRAEVRALRGDVHVAARFRAPRARHHRPRRPLRDRLRRGRQRDALLGPGAGPRDLRLLARGRHRPRDGASAVVGLVGGEALERAQPAARGVQEVARDADVLELVVRRLDDPVAREDADRGAGEGGQDRGVGRDDELRARVDRVAQQRQQRQDAVGESGVSGSSSR